MITADSVKDLTSNQILQWKYTMQAQLDSGLKFSRDNIPKIVAERFGLKYSTKKDIPVLIAECDAQLLIIEHMKKGHYHDPTCRACKETGPVRGL